MSVRVIAFNALQALFAENDEQLAELRRQMFVVGDPNVVALSKHPAFPDRADYMPSGFYRNTGDIPIVKDLGSVSDYVAFKQTLAEQFAGKPLGTIFEEPAPCPFLELLFFSETGAQWMFGPKTSEKLARDFADHRGQAEEVGGPFFNRFALLQQAFEFASRSGAVAFSAY